MKRPSCRTKVADPTWTTSAIVPAVPDMRFRVWRCPSCGYQQYEVDDDLDASIRLASDEGL